MLGGLLLLVVSLAGGADPAPDCRSALRAQWAAIGEAMGGSDMTPVLKGLAQVEVACEGDAQVQPLLTTMHAEADLRDGRPQAALDRLETRPVDPTARLWTTSRWVQLSALEMVGDIDGFNQARDRFLTAHDRALTSGPNAMKKVERFETPLAVVDAYEGRIQNGDFVRLIVFIASPKAGGMPVTLAVGLDPMTDMIAGRGKTHYFLDLYPCDSHVTMDIIERKPKDGPPPYAEMKARATTLFSGADIFPPFAKRDVYRFCAFESFMLPGFDRGRDDS